MTSLLHLDLPQLIETAGYLGLFCIVFAESGLFFGFFFPGDSLLFTAGLLSSQGLFDPWIVCATVAIAAILGDSAGYWFGKKIGPSLFSRDDSFFFHKKHLERTEEFYARFGPRAIFFARFVPIVRTFAPIFAGVGRMPYPLFLSYNIAGGLVWGIGCTLLGFFLGTALPGSEQYLLPITLAIIILSIVPIAHEWYRSRSR